jgi:hypothetical protein
VASRAIAGAIGRKNAKAVVPIIRSAVARMISAATSQLARLGLKEVVTVVTTLVVY